MLPRCSVSTDDHDWEFVDGMTFGWGWFRPAYNLWTKYRCKSCRATRFVAAGLASYEPPGEDIAGFGQLAPPCPKAA